MSGSPRQSRQALSALTDSPWFWVLLFSAAGIVFLLAFSPKYAERQRRLEMQYYARQEIARRQVEGTDEARQPGQEGAAPPPAAGELIIPLWPLLLVFGAMFAFSAARLWQGARLGAGRASRPGDGDEP